MGPRRFGTALAALLVVALSPSPARADLAPVVALPTFDPIFQNDAAVRSVVARLGLPDRAEVVPIAVGSPWVRYELRAYYLQAGHMFVFMRASPRDGDVSILRYQGPIPPEPLAPASASVATAHDPDRAAAEAEARAAEAERAAARAEAIAEEMDRDFKQSLGKGKK
jgi:hypothetical protein